MKKAFTLLEILIVITLMGFLIGISMTLVNGMDEVKQKVSIENTLNNLKEAVIAYEKDVGHQPLDISALIDGTEKDFNGNIICTSVGTGDTVCSSCNNLNNNENKWNGPYFHNKDFVFPPNVQGCTDITNSLYFLQKHNFNPLGTMNGFLENFLVGSNLGIQAWDLTQVNHFGGLNTIPTTAISQNLGGTFLVFPQMVNNNNVVHDYNYATMDDPEFLIGITKAKLLHYGNKCMIIAFTASKQNSQYANLIMSLESSRDNSELQLDDFTETTTGYYYADIHPDSNYWYVAIPIIETTCDF